MGSCPTPRSGGWLLVGLIVLISAVILALVGITFYLTEHLRTTSLRQNQTRAIYLAQAGVMQALRDYQTGAGITLRAYNVDNPGGPVPGPNDDAFTLSGPTPDFLLINMRSNVRFNTSKYCPSAGRNAVTRQYLERWVVRNVLASGQGSLTIDKVRVTWFPDGDEGVLRLNLNTNDVWTAPGCNAVTISQMPIDIPNQTLAAGDRWSTNQIWFTPTTGMQSKQWIDVAFILSDGTELGSRYTPLNPDQAEAKFTLRSTGEVREGAFPFAAWRRLKAVYRICATGVDAACDKVSDEQSSPGAILSYEELASLTP